MRLFTVGVVVIAAAVVLALMLVRPASTGTAVVCPEDAMQVGPAACIATDDFGVCRVMAAWARRVDRAGNRPKIERVAYRARDRACAWQENQWRGMLR